MTLAGAANRISVYYNMVSVIFTRPNQLCEAHCLEGFITEFFMDVQNHGNVANVVFKANITFPQNCIQTNGWIKPVF